jgi:hypothetical protein
LGSVASSSSTPCRGESLSSITAPSNVEPGRWLCRERRERGTLREGVVVAVVGSPSALD